MENEDINKALDIVEKSAMTEEQLYAYERFWDAVNRENVLAEGKYAEGMVKKSLEIARRMKADKMPIDVIVKYTGLTAEEIDTL